MSIYKKLSWTNLARQSASIKKSTAESYCSFVNNKNSFNSISDNALCLAFIQNENKSIIKQIEAEMKKRQLNCN